VPRKSAEAGSMVAVSRCALGGIDFWFLLSKLF
jgi:hypothetical protein